jgi:hypothetical protein
MLTLHFHRTNSPIGKAIRLQTGGSVNHVSCNIRFSKIEADMRKGVHHGYNEDTIVESFTFEKGDLTEAMKFAFEQIGKKYDWLGILSFIWNFVPEKIGAWYCSELAMVLLMKFLGITNYSQKQSPQTLLELCRILKQANV